MGFIRVQWRHKRLRRSFSNYYADDATWVNKTANRCESKAAISEIRKRSGHKDASPEDVVTMALEVFNVLTQHLSREDSKVLAAHARRRPPDARYKTHCR